MTGTVQGVGFRPFVYRHAVRLGLAGFVRNDSAGVLIEVEGPTPAVAELRRVLVEEPPPLARVAAVATSSLPLVGAGEAGPGGFSIAGSDDEGIADVPVSVDTGPCEQCLEEVDDPADRRNGYAFTNCTNCGPRYTIIVSVPYDRPATTMAGFKMCPECQREYDDPADRRFHAQPNACPVCGPRLSFLGPDGRPRPDAGNPLGAAAAALRGGAVLAVKGVGGYHLAVDATSSDAVAELRRRKARDDKPFAVMVGDIEAAAGLIELDKEGAAVLVSPRRPIVLGRWRPGAPVVAAVAPGLTELGVMLPYSPLHHLLLAAVGRPLVMTSGNLSDEPIAYTDDDAATRLGTLVDAILAHDRPIHIRCDDSVVRAREGRTQVLRRSRGYAPEPLTLPVAARRPLLAVGAELKSTVAVAKGPNVVASHHLGDLEHLATYRSFLQAVDHLCLLCGVIPEVIAHDLHPEYLSTKWAADKWAAELDLAAVTVQHHHAHIASCLVDHGRDGPVLGVAFDGLGYGPDATMWGGEFLVADLAGYERVGHLRSVELPGGAAAVREPWRMAVAWTRRSCGPTVAGEVGSRLDKRAPDLVSWLDRPGPSMVLTSSVGRLFDAVAAMVCGRSRVTYEGQAAIELEALAAAVRPGSAESYPVEIAESGKQLILDPSPLVSAVIDDLGHGREAAQVAAAFHEGVAAATVEAATRLAAGRGLHTVALSGGVFQNARLSGLVEAGLVARGLEVLVHRQVPPNDGGISIGQAAVAARITA
ncbi:MAG: carbamoyltransferase HypF [Acidimicrobiales bacterium]